MGMLDGAVLLGNIYDPDTDCQYLLLRVTSKNWDKFNQQQMDKDFVDIDKVIEK